MGGLAANLLGMTEKAMLIIYDKRQAAASAPDKLGGSVLAQAGNLLAGDAAPGGAPNAVKRYFSVQFNPSSLSLYSAGRDSAVSSVSEMGTAETQNTPLEAQSAVLTVPLLFDDVSPPIAFLSELVPVSGTNALKIGASLARSAAQEHSVRPYVEGLIAAAKNKLTREACFAWNSFQFEGTIESVSAEYTMFSIFGEPIRATVSLKISQTLRADIVQRYSDDFSEAFGCAGFNVSSGGGVSGALSPFLGGISGFL